MHKLTLIKKLHVHSKVRYFGLKLLDERADYYVHFLPEVQCPLFRLTFHCKMNIIYHRRIKWTHCVLGRDKIAAAFFETVSAHVLIGITAPYDNTYIFLLLAAYQSV